jgi:hypothetical protein
MVPGHKACGWNGADLPIQQTTAVATGFFDPLTRNRRDLVAKETIQAFALCGAGDE